MLLSLFPRVQFELFSSSCWGIGLQFSQVIIISPSQEINNLKVQWVADAWSFLKLCAFIVQLLREEVVEFGAHCVYLTFLST